MLLLTPLTPYLWAQRTAPGQLEIGGLNSGTTMHQVQSKKKKRKDNIVILDNSSLCGVSSQPITWHLYVTILWFILLRPIDTQHGGRGEPVYGNSRSSGYKQWSFGMASSTLQCGRVRKNRKDWDMWHICASEILMLRFLILFVQRMFCNGKKELHLWQTLKIEERPQKIVLFSLFFSAYCNCWCLSIQRGRYVCVSLWNGKEKTVAVWQKKDLWFRLSASKSIMLTLSGMSGLSCVYMVMLAPRPWSNPVSSPVH